MKNRSEHAIILSCNPGYGFGMMASMNAQNYFGTDADWEIAYEDYTDEERRKISDAFPFNVEWTHVSDLMKTVVDRREKDKSVGPLNRFWLAYWLMAHKVLKEGKYKSVCVIQADQFVFVNLDKYFAMSDKGMLVCSEHSFTGIKVADMFFGDDKAIWDRGVCPIFDSVNFIGQSHIQFPRDIVEFQCEDAFKGESSHSVIALNRSLLRHGTKETAIGLPGREWACDSIWGDFRIEEKPDKIIIAGDGSQLKSWHARWWQKGRVASEWHNNYASIMDSPTAIRHENAFYNYQLVKKFMEGFNNMTPSVRSEEFEHDDVTLDRFRREK